MKIGLECIPCFVRQAFEAGLLVAEKEEVRELILREVLSNLSGQSFDKSPPSVGREVHGIIRRVSGDNDPYLEIKRKSNKLIEEQIPVLKECIRNSKDSFETSVRLSIAGNIIDYGHGEHITEEMINNTISQSLKQPIDKKNIKKLKEEIKKASDILFLGDNAGEIFFDRLFLEELRGYPVTFAVRGGPIINDALKEDAVAAGIDKLVPLIDNGYDAPGTILEECSVEFKKRFAKADLIIAKGQGNYETLSSTDKKIFFLLKAKCPVIARDIGCRKGDMVISQKN